MKKESRVIESAKRGFTLVELLVVVAIIGILGTVAMKSFIGATDGAKETAAQASVNNIKGAVELYKIQNNKSRLPTDLRELIKENGDQEPMLDGGEGALIDPWGTEYKLEVKGNGKRFAIVCAGPDGQFGTEDDIRSDVIKKQKN